MRRSSYTLELVRPSTLQAWGLSILFALLLLAVTAGIRLSLAEHGFSFVAAVLPLALGAIAGAFVPTRSEATPGERNLIGLVLVTVAFLSLLLALAVPQQSFLLSLLALWDVGLLLLMGLFSYLLTSLKLAIAFFVALTIILGHFLLALTFGAVIG